MNIFACLLPEDEFKTLFYSAMMLSYPIYKLLTRQLDVELFGDINSSGIESRIPKGDVWFKKYIGMCYVLDSGISFKMEQRETKSFEEIQFLGILVSHSNKCNDESCACKFFAGKRGKMMLMNSQELASRIVSYNYKVRTEFFEEQFNKFPQTNWMRILFCQLILQTRPEQYITALSVISKVKMAKASALERYLIVRLNEKIFEIIEGEAIDNQLDLKSYINYQKYLKFFRSKISSICKKTLDFWQNYRQPYPKIHKICDLSMDIDHDSKAVTKLWKKMQTKASYFSIDQNLTMALYFSLLRNSQSKSDELLKVREKVLAKYYTEFHKVPQITDKTLLDPANIFLRIDMSKDSLGNILSISENVYRSYGLRAGSLVGKDLGMLIPKFLRTYHKKALEDHLYEGTTNRLNKNMLVYGEDVEGFTVPQQIFISSFPDEKYNFSYLCIIRPNLNHYDNLTLLESGEFAGISKGFAKQFGIDPKIISKFNFNRFCPGFDRINRLINYSLFLDFMKVDSPIWLHDNAESDLEVQERSGLPPPFNKYPEKAKHLDIPASEEEYHAFNRQMRELLLKGTDLEVMPEFGGHGMQRCFYKASIRCEILNDGTFVKYLTLIKTESTKKTDFGTTFGRENTQELIYETGSQEADASGDIESGNAEVECFAFTNKNEYFSDFKNKTAKHINKAPAKATKKHTFVSPKFVKSDLPSTRRELKEKNRSNRVMGDSQDPSYMNEGIKSYMEEEKFRKENAKFVDNYVDGFEDFDKKFQEFQGETSVSGSVTSRFSLGLQRIEHSIENNTEPITRVLTNIFMYFYLIVVVALILWSAVAVDEFITEIQGTFLIRDFTMKRKFDLLELGRTMRGLQLERLGYIDNQYAEAVNFRDESLASIKYLSEEIGLNNNRIRQNIHLFDEFIVMRYFEGTEIDVVPRLEDRNIGIKMNEFDLVVSILSAVDKILSQDSVDISTEDIDLNYILNNMNGDLLVKIDKEFDIISYHIHFSFYESDTTFKECLGGVAGISIAYFILYFTQEFTAKKKREHFYNAMLMVEERDITLHLNTVNQFYSGLQRFEEQDKFSSSIKGAHSKQKSTDIGKDSKKLVRTPDLKKMDLKLVVRSILLMTMVVISVMVFYFLLLNIFNMKSKVDSKMTDLKILEDQLFKYSLIFGGFFQLIGTNGSSILQDDTVEKTIRNDLLFLKNVQEKLIQTAFSDDSATIESIISHDLCMMYASSKELCYNHDRLAASRGLVHLNSFMLSAIQSGLSKYQNSEKSVADLKNILINDDIIDSKVQYDQVYRNAFLDLNRAYMDQLKNLASEGSDNNLKIGIAMVFVVILLGIVGKFGVLESIYVENKKTKMILRMIPTRIILKTKILNNYLFKSSFSILGNGRQIKL